MNTKIRQLQEAGYRVLVSHRRPYVIYDGIENEVLPAITRHHAQVVADAEACPVRPVPQGGQTVVKILSDAGEVVGLGKARCSKRDNYNKRLGVEIALGRAIKDLRQYGG